MARRLQIHAHMKLQGEYATYTLQHEQKEHKSASNIGAMRCNRTWRQSMWLLVFSKALLWWAQALLRKLRCRRCKGLKLDTCL